MSHQLSTFFSFPKSLCMLCVSSAAQLFFVSFLRMPSFLSFFLPQSPGIFPSRLFLLSPPLPHMPPFPLGSPHPALLQLPHQPVSFSLMLQANRVEQSGRRRPRGKKPLSSPSALWAHPPRPPASFQLSLPMGAGRRGRRQEERGSLS